MSKALTETKLRAIAAGYWAEDPTRTPSGFVMIHAGEVCGWALNPDPKSYIPGVAAVPPSPLDRIMWTAGGTRDGATRMSYVQEIAPRQLAPGIPEEVTTAIEQLQGSERGTAAGVAFAGLIYNGGSGLDSNNWRALETLCRACRMSGGNTAVKIAEALSK